MEQVADLVMRKKQRIKTLEDKKIQTEEQLQEAELTLEDLDNKLYLNNQQLNDLVAKEENKKITQDKLIKLISKNMFILFLLFTLSAIINPSYAVLIVIYIIYNIPKYISLIKEMRKTWKMNLTVDIKNLRNEIISLQNSKDQALSALRKLEYTIADIDTEKKVIEDILIFILENQSNRDNASPKLNNLDDLSRTRINPLYS